MTSRLTVRRSPPANDNPLWAWRGRCSACDANMGPVRDAPLCHSCTDTWLAGLKGPNGETVNTTDVPDALRRIGIVGLYKHTPCKLVVSNPLPSGDDVS